MSECKPLRSSQRSALPCSMVVALALMINGCASHSGIHSSGELRSVDSFAAQKTFTASPAAAVDENWPAQHWWQVFNDPQLNALIDEALAHSPTLDMAAARVHSAQAYVGTARAAQSPDINASGDISYQKLSETWIYPPPYGGSSMFNNTLRLNASYELDFWGKNRAGVKAAVAQERASAAEQQSTLLVLTSNIAKTYIELDRLYALRDVVAQMLDERTKIFTLIQQRFNAGLDNKAEVKQAESQLPALRGQLAQIDEAIGATRNALSALAGTGPDRGLQIQRPHLSAPSNTLIMPHELPLNLLGRRPDIVATRWQAEAAQQQADVAKAQFYPNISLTGYIGYSSLGLDNLVSSRSEESGIGPAIRIPIFAGGRLRQNLRQQYASYDFAVANYNATLTNALHDVADQLNAINALQKRQAEQRDAANIAHSALNFATQRYQAGIGNYVSVLNAENIVLNQDQLGVELNSRAQQLHIELIRALGGGYENSQTAAND